MQRKNTLLLAALMLVNGAAATNAYAGVVLSVNPVIVAGQPAPVVVAPPPVVVGPPLVYYGGHYSWGRHYYGPRHGAFRPYRR